MDHIEQGNRFVRFVGLKLPDQMQLHAGVALLQRWPFGRRFLNAVFTEEHLAFVNQRLNIFGRAGFRHRNQMNVFGRTPGHLGGCRHAFTDCGQRAGGCFWCRFLHSATL